MSSIRGTTWWLFITGCLALPASFMLVHRAVLDGAGLLNDAGLNILGIPWWVWLASGLLVAGIAIIAAPELLAFAPDLIEAAEVAEEAAAAAQEAAVESSLEEQGVSEAVEQALQDGSAIQGELGDAVGQALREGAEAGNDAYWPAYAQNLAEQAQNVIDAEKAARFGMVLGSAAAGVGATQVPAAIDDLSGAGQAGAAPSGPDSGGNPAPDPSGNAGNPG